MTVQVSSYITVIVQLLMVVLLWKRRSYFTPKSSVLTIILLLVNIAAYSEFNAYNHNEMIYRVIFTIGIIFILTSFTEITFAAKLKEYYSSQLGLAEIAYKGDTSRIIVRDRQGQRYILSMRQIFLNNPFIPIYAQKRARVTRPLIHKLDLKEHFLRIGESEQNIADLRSLVEIVAKQPDLLLYVVPGKHEHKSYFDLNLFLVYFQVLDSNSQMIGFTRFDKLSKDLRLQLIDFDFGSLTMTELYENFVLSYESLDYSSQPRLIINFEGIHSYIIRQLRQYPLVMRKNMVLMDKEMEWLARLKEPYNYRLPRTLPSDYHLNHAVYSDLLHRSARINKPTSILHVGSMTILQPLVDDLTGDSGFIATLNSGEGSPVALPIMHLLTTNEEFGLKWLQYLEILTTGSHTRNFGSNLMGLLRKASVIDRMTPKGELQLDALGTAEFYEKYQTTNAFRLLQDTIRTNYVDVVQHPVFNGDSIADIQAKLKGTEVLRFVLPQNGIIRDIYIVTLLLLKDWNVLPKSSWLIVSQEDTAILEMYIQFQISRQFPHHVIWNASNIKYEEQLLSYKSVHTLTAVSADISDNFRNLFVKDLTLSDDMLLIKQGTQVKLVRYGHFEYFGTDSYHQRFGFTFARFIGSISVGLVSIGVTIRNAPAGIKSWMRRIVDWIRDLPTAFRTSWNQDGVAKKLTGYTMFVLLLIIFISDVRGSMS